jgi:hypothetical protein
MKFSPELHFHDYKSLQQVEHDGDTWVILGRGRTNDQGQTYCHLASTTRARKQKNGFNPIQATGWLNIKLNGVEQ